VSTKLFNHKMALLSCCDHDQMHNINNEISLDKMNNKKPNTYDQLSLWHRFILRWKHVIFCL